ncbi:P-loop containing nucleoside triphosphate hydrolase protein [Gigaspora margarita]|uniref:P-loop containing nucleoside triphosphate hydrolase protein n=1 Tax=Gigaspora margarita TaxID=4874 RepID=A0A8H3WXZ3_GIGMA|nr:P-loop containing nucleoside triphosphate hydrolase protein [Gigaspora margarita]
MGQFYVVQVDVGKTLTAEAISEYLHRPLDAISVGELGMISVILKYDDLDELTRAQIWHTFLDRADGKDESQVDIDKLKQRRLNDREVKTAALAAKSDSDANITTSNSEKFLDISVKNP